MNNLEELKRIIIKSHIDDLNQQEVIFSKEPRILVEAPAGYGKTHTMISKIAYLIASGEISGFKKILALTFSVNAAHKIRKDVEEKLPILLKEATKKSKSKVFATNYHGFCINILKKYGYLLSENLRNIDKLERLDITRSNFYKYSSITPQENLKGCILAFDEEVKYYYNDPTNFKEKKERFKILLDNYNKLIINQFIPKGKITYNSIISLTIELFNKYPFVKNFYTKYFPFIIVDEYQDTNILNLRLLQTIIDDSSKLLFMGDSIQRIYGFIGAVPDLLPKSLRFYNMKLIELEKNYRFKDNPLLLNIDSLLRRKYKDLNYIDKINGIKNIVFEENDQSQESQKIIELLSTLSEKEKTAILFKQRGNNTNITIELLDKTNIQYFYALFSEEDIDYLNFHKTALSIYLEVKEDRTYNTYTHKINYVLKNIREKFKKDIEHNRVISSLYKLIEIFFSKTKKHPVLDERYEIILEVLKNNSLKHYLNSVQEHLILSTIHGAKGLEWDNVILPDMESKTSCWALCNVCDKKNGSMCDIDFSKINQNHALKKIFLEELSTFYVGVTRAKKNLYFTYSDYSYDNFGKYIKSGPSCFLKILLGEI